MLRCCWWCRFSPAITVLSVFPFEVLSPLAALGTEPVHAVDLFLVDLEVVLVPRGPVAHVALEGPQLEVDRVDVLLELPQVAERVGAVVANVLLVNVAGLVLLPEVVASIFPCLVNS